MRRIGFMLAASLGLAGGLPLVVPPALAVPTDPLPAIIQRVDAFIHRSEVDGVALDPRHLGDYSEMLRLTVVTQLAAYCEIQAVSPSLTTRQDIVDRADFLTRFGSALISHDPADGMMAYALMRAFEATGTTRYRDFAYSIVTPLLTLDETPVATNRALMAAMALAEYYFLTGDPVALTQVHDIVTLAARSQHADGSFPHACDVSRDIHYTAWIAMELDRIGERVNDPNVSRVLDGVVAFQRARIDTSGAIRYQDTLSSGATIYYYSRPLCPADYDTRGWVNELAYHALLFDRYRDPLYHAMMARLAALESQGGFPDKWDYLPTLGDPLYDWATSQRSVMRSSVVLWSLSCIQSRRTARARADYQVAAKAGAEAIAGNDLLQGDGPATSRLGPLGPNPVRDRAWIALRLARPGEARVSLFDPAGRRVRTLLFGHSEAGERRLSWDLRDDAGRRVGAGVYFVRFDAEGRTHSGRLVVIE